MEDNKPSSHQSEQQVPPPINSTEVLPTPNGLERSSEKVMSGPLFPDSATHTQPEIKLCDLSDELSRQLEDIIKTYGSAASLVEEKNTHVTDKPEKGESFNNEDGEYEETLDEAEKEQIASGDASGSKESSIPKEQKLEKKILKGLGK